MRQTLRLGALIAAAGVIAYGMLQPVERETIWLITVWVCAPLLGLFAWLSSPNMPRGLARSTYQLGVVVGIGFVLLSLQLLRQQGFQSEAIANYIATAGDGSTISNVRPVLDAQRIVRGTIFDRYGTPLVASQAVDGFAQRVYPLADRYDPSAFGNLIGYFSNRYGASGIEATYGGYLSGTRGDPLGQMRQQWLGETRRGNDLTLTLNADLQQRAAALLGERVGSVVVLDPRSGAVLALVSRPGFDPRGLSFNPAAPSWADENARIEAYWRELNGDGAGQPLLNRAVQGQYPPGSTYKTLTAIGALSFPEVGMPDQITCPNRLDVEAGAPPVVNAVEDLGGIIGEANLNRVFAYSCNTAFAQYALRLGVERMEEIAARFDILSPDQADANYSGFTDLPTASSLLFVQAGFLRQPRALADTGYGQGQLLVTPLQMAMVAAAVANDGVMMRPYLVERVNRPSGELIEATVVRPIRRVMSSTVAERMRAAMGEVAEYGFGRVVSQQVVGVQVGGKSGTAEHIPGLPPHAWFIAIGPLNESRYAVAVMLESGGEGSGPAAILAGQVLQAAFETER